MNVFVSHSHTDRPIAEKLMRELLTRGIEVSSCERVPPGESWQKTISELLKSCDGVILLIGAKNVPSLSQRREWSAALEAKWENPDKQLIPVLLPDAEIPTFLSEYQPLRLKRSKQAWTSAVNELINLLHHESTPSKVTGSRNRDSAKRNERLQYIEKVAENLRQR